MLIITTNMKSENLLHERLTFLRRREDFGLVLLFAPLFTFLGTWMFLGQFLHVLSDPVGVWNSCLAEAKLHKAALGFSASLMFIFIGLSFLIDILYRRMRAIYLCRHFAKGDNKWIEGSVLKFRLESCETPFDIQHLPMRCAFIGLPMLSGVFALYSFEVNYLGLALAIPLSIYSFYIVLFGILTLEPFLPIIEVDHQPAIRSKNFHVIVLGHCNSWRVRNVSLTLICLEASTEFHARDSWSNVSEKYCECIATKQTQTEMFGNDRMIFDIETHVPPGFPPTMRYYNPNNSERREVNWFVVIERTYIMNFKKRNSFFLIVK